MNISSPLLPSPYTCVRILSDPSQHGPALCVSVRVPLRMFFVSLKRLLLLLRLTINKHSQLGKKMNVCFVLLLFVCLSAYAYDSKIQSGSAIVSWTSRSPYHCAPLVCVLNFSTGLAAWQIYKQTHKQFKSMEYGRVLHLCFRYKWNLNLSNQIFPVCHGTVLKSKNTNLDQFRPWKAFFIINHCFVVYTPARNHSRLDLCMCSACFPENMILKH